MGKWNWEVPVHAWVQGTCTGAVLDPAILRLWEPDEWEGI